MCMCVLAQGPLFSTRRNRGVRKLKRKSLLSARAVVYPITPYSSSLSGNFRTRETGTASFSSASAGAKREEEERRCALRSEQRLFLDLHIFS